MTTTTTTSTTSRHKAMTQMTSDSLSLQEQLAFLNKFKDQETDLSRCAAVDSLDFDSEDDGDYSPFVPLSQKAIKRELRVLGCYKQPRKPSPSKTLFQEFLEGLPLPLEVLSQPLPPFCAPLPPTRESLIPNCEPSLFPSHKPPPHPPDPSTST